MGVDWSLDDRADPEKSIYAMAWFLDWIRAYVGRPGMSEREIVIKMLYGYNAGPGNAVGLANGYIPPYRADYINSILAKSDPENVELHARAYNTLGTALRKAGRDREALLAFLHVDVLYFALPEAHAEALANLAQLWDAMHKTERAVRTRAILDEQYRGSPWAKKAG